MIKRQLQSYLIDVVGLKYNRDKEVEEMTKKELKEMVEECNGTSLEECRDYSEK